MLRRDYFLRIVEQFAQIIARIARRTEAGEFAEASVELDGAFQQLVGLGPEAAAELSESDLLARLMMDGPTHLVKTKSFILVDLLLRAGDLHAAAQREPQAQACWLKALNLMLALQLQDADGDFSEFIPKIDLLSGRLDSIPPVTQAALWRHYERIGAYGRAEDALFMLLETDGENPALLIEARAFYERILRENDATLEAGNLPRAEAKSGLTALGVDSSLHKNDC